MGFGKEWVLNVLINVHEQILQNGNWILHNTSAFAVLGTLQQWIGNNDLYSNRPKWLGHWFIHWLLTRHHNASRNHINRDRAGPTQSSCWSGSNPFAIGVGRNGNRSLVTRRLILSSARPYEAPVIIKSRIIIRTSFEPRKPALHEYGLVRLQWW